MKETLRPIARRVLISLTKLAISKHNPTIIAVIGGGETTLVKELTHIVINSMYPCRRNLETPEAEFSVPLSVLGYPSYPTTAVEWIWVLVKTIIQLVSLKEYNHFLVLELDTVNHQIQDLWIKTLDPDLIIDTGLPQRLILSTKQVPIPLKSDLFINAKAIAVKAGVHFGIDAEIATAVLSGVELPKARINFTRGANNCIVLDATHYYFPISIKSVLEVVDPSIPKIIVFSDNPADKEFISNHAPQIDLNPRTYSLDKETLVVLRGNRTQTLRKFNNSILK